METERASLVSDSSNFADGAKSHGWNSPVIPNSIVEDGSTFDVVIVGAGIAGASLGYALGKRGYRVAVIERSLSEPDRIVGELLQPGGVLKLEALGLESCIEDIDGIEVLGYAVSLKETREKLTYPLHNGRKVLGKSFHHGRFVQKLRKAASEVSNVKLIEGTVKQMIEDKDNDLIIGAEYTEKAAGAEVKKRVYGSFNVICDGCASNLRGKMGIERPVAKSEFVGLLLEGVQLPMPKHGHVFLGDPAPILSYQIGTNDTRILVDIPQPVPKGKDRAEFLRTVTAPQLPEEMREKFFEAIDKGNIKQMANSRLHPSEHYLKNGMIVLGDAWNMRHPLTGGGMTVALNDVVVLRDVLCAAGNLADHAKVRNHIQDFFVQRKPLAATINILAFALYNVFASPYDPKYVSLRSACFGYFQLGGRCVSGPLYLLSGISPNPYHLLTHFFLVALYGVFQALKPFPTPSKIARAYRLLSDAAWIVIPLMRGEKIFAPFVFMLTLLFVNFNKPKKEEVSSE